MRTLYVILISILFVSCSSEVDDNLVLTTEIDGTNASTITSYPNTPEGVVAYFYASKIRDDQNWEKVVPKVPQQSNRMIRKLIKYKKWKFLKYKFVSKKEKGEDKVEIKIFMEIEINGKKDSGKDDVLVEKIKGKWTITNIPT